MNRTFQALLLALFLSAVGITIFLHKALSSDIPLLPNQVYKSWYVETKVAVTSEGSLLQAEEALPTTIQLQLPQNSQRYRLVDEDFVNPGFERQIKTQKNPTNRVATFTNEQAKNSTTLFYRVIVDEQENFTDSDSNEVSLAGRRLVKQEFAEFDRDERAAVEEKLQENPPDAAIKSLLKIAEEKSSDSFSLAQNIYDLALNSEDIRVQTIRNTIGVEKSTAEIAAFLLQKAQIPTRIGNGILLTSEEVYATDFVRWLEIQSEDKDGWLAYDPVNRSFGEQDRYLTWWYGSSKPLAAKGSGDITLEVLVRPNIDNGLTKAIWQEQAATNPFLEYSLLKLPLATQRVFQVLVLVPIGALIVAFLHQVIGLPTFGTFTPILIALSFRETGLIRGISLFILVVSIGLLIRACFNRLQLLVVPRLGAILTTTVLIMGGLAIVMKSFNLSLGLSISLFPIVILAMTIERAAMMWEEEGGKEVIIASLGSLAVAILGYLCTINPYIQHLAFAFPELLLVVLSLNILLGRYNGYKLTEYFRFLSLQRQLNQSKG
ncbi:MAG: UUP1 family membrane protein [Spirulinaceae cyanobacterium]